MRILVTGGAGYIGSHTAKLLAHSGYEPVTFDNLSTGHRSAVRWGPLVEGDLANPGQVRKVIRQYRIDAVVHFAASAYVGESMSEPRKYFQNNVVNTLNLLDAMLDSDVKQIVFSSSCATYGIPNAVPVTEDSPQRPINPYGESKLFVERVLHWYGEAYSMRGTALRYFNAAGADLDGEIGENHDPETHLIPLVMHAALGKRPHIDLYGTNYPTLDGTAIRDYVHVTDLAEAHVLALRHLIDGGPSVALNLSAGRGHSIQEVITEVERVSGLRVLIHEAPRRAGDPAVLVGDPARAEDVLGWRAEHSSLESIIQTAWTWQKRAAG